MMPKYLFTLLLCLWVAAAASAQDAKLSPQPTPLADKDVVKVSTNLIQVDVSVVGKDGKPVTDLRPDEFEIYQNGKKQPLTHFSFISAGRAGAKSASDKGGISTGKGGLILPPVTLGPGSVRRTIALVIDDLNLSWDSIRYTRKALQNFVDEQMQEGDLVAILRTAGGVGALQQFTEDKRLLYASIDRIKYNPMGTGGISALASIEASSKETIDTGMGTMFSAEEEAQIAAFLQAAKDALGADISSGTLGALHYVIDGMKDLPGKRSAILFSDGFRLLERDQRSTLPAIGGNRNAPPPPSKPSGWQSGTTMLVTRQVIDEAKRSGVVFYAIDPRGLQPGTLTPSDSATSRGKSVRDLRIAVAERQDEVWESQNGLNMISTETGGFAIFNNNDPSTAVGKILENQSYYLIAYVPDADTFEASDKYNKAEIKVLRKDATARYGNNLSAGPTAQTKPVPVAKKESSPLAEMKEALFSPFAVGGIALRVNSLWGRDTDNSSYVTTLLHVDAGDLKFTEEKEGSQSCSFDVLAASFGSNGQVVDQIAKRYSMTIPPEQYKKVIADGFVYHFKFPVTKAGGYQYRVAIRDVVTGKVGAASQFVDVPDLSNGKLTLSSIAVEDMSIGEFQGLASGSSVKTDPMRDTSRRRIKVGRVYRYSLEVYTEGVNALKKPDIETRIRVFREGQLILAGPPKSLDMTGQTDMSHLKFIGGLAIGSQMELGDYVLQIIVIDKDSKGKRQIASQFVQFEVIK